eukprot:4949919-Prymnesium_polylepis.1
MPWRATHRTAQTAASPTRACGKLDSRVNLRLVDGERPRVHQRQLDAAQLDRLVLPHAEHESGACQRVQGGSVVCAVEAHHDAMASQLHDRHDSILRKPGAPIGARCEDVPVADLQRQRRLRNRMVDAAHHADVIEERGLGERVRARIVARLRRPVARDVPAAVGSMSVSDDTSGGALLRLDRIRGGGCSTPPPRARTAETQAILLSHLVDQRVPALLDRVERAQDAALPCGMQAAGVVATVQPLDRGATCAVVVCVEEVGHERHRDGLLVPCLAGERVPLQRGGGAVAELQEEGCPRRIVEMPPRSREVERALLGEDGAVEHAGDEARGHQLCDRR